HRENDVEVGENVIAHMRVGPALPHGVDAALVRRQLLGGGTAGTQQTVRGEGTGDDHDAREEKYGHHNICVETVMHRSLLARVSSSIPRRSRQGSVTLYLHAGGSQCHGFLAH